MALLRRLLARMRALRRSKHAERDLDDELRAYVEARTAWYAERGRTPAEARRAALVEIGGVEQVKEGVRAVHAGAAAREALRDVRYGLRVLRRSPGYALVVVLTLGLGIGVNAAVFSVMHAVLWRALPYPDPSALVVIAADTRALPTAYASSGAVLDVGAAVRSISSLAQVEGRDASLEIDGVMEQVAAVRVTDDLLPLLGASSAMLGRPLRASLDTSGVTLRGVVVSHALWQRRLHADPSAIGRRLTVNNMPVQVVGVLPAGFRLVLPAANHVQEQVDLVLPREPVPGALYRGLPSLGRLRPGVTVAQAQAEVDVLTASFVARHPSAYPNGLQITVRPLAEAVTRDVQPALLALAAAVGFVLLIAGVNVINLLLARAKTRERELAVRRALGATRFRLVRQLLAESLVLAVLGGACGLLVAQVAVDALAWLRPAHLPRQSEIAIDGMVVVWTMGLTVVSAVVFGLLPALAFTREASGQALPSSRTGSLQLRSRRLQRGLVVAEVALSIVPLVAAGLMLRTFVALLDTPLGFEPAHVVTARVSLNLRSFSTVDRRSAFYSEAAARVRELPGVEAASVGGPPPLAPVQGTTRFRRGGEPDAPFSIGIHRSVMPGYLGVMGIPLRAGRDISNEDIRHRRRVVVVDERTAAQLWPGEAVGQRLAVEYAREPLEVIGVAGQIRGPDIRDAATPMIYVPSHLYEIEQTLVVRTRAPLAAIGPEIKRAVEALGPGRPVFDIRSMGEILAASIDTTRFTMLVLSAFAIASLGLAGVGLYGTLAYLTSQRTQEFGVRVALGASASGILRLVVGEGCMLTVAGLVLGLGGAVLVTRALRGLLYGVTPLDAPTLAAVVLLLGAVALAAIAWPAWRASRVDPTTALRAE